MWVSRGMTTNERNEPAEYEVAISIGPEAIGPDVLCLEFKERGEVVKTLEVPVGENEIIGELVTIWTTSGDMKLVDDTCEAASDSWMDR